MMIPLYRLIPVLLMLACQPSLGQPKPERSLDKPSVQSVLDVGIRFQKTLNLYTENGLAAQYTNPKLAAGRLYLGASYVTSRLGTALNSYAIKQDNTLVSAAYYFHPNWQLRPFIKANVGYFNANYGDAIFDELPQSSLLASPELGLCYCPNFPLKINGSVGFNLITGNGISGPGTVYPVFVQTSLTWNILKKFADRR